MKITGCCVSILTFLMCHWLILAMITNTTQGSQAIYSTCTPFSTSKIIRNKEPTENTPCHSEHVYIFYVPLINPPPPSQTPRPRPPPTDIYCATLRSISVSLFSVLSRAVCNRTHTGVTTQVDWKLHKFVSVNNYRPPYLYHTTNVGHSETR
jgi:hypothetical protein